MLEGIAVEDMPELRTVSNMTRSITKSRAVCTPIALFTDYAHKCLNPPWCNFAMKCMITHFWRLSCIDDATPV
jgi:hypothetical protein